MRPKNILIINPWVGKIGPNTFLYNFLIGKPNTVNINVTVIYPFSDNISKGLENLGCKVIYNKYLVFNHYNNFVLKIFRRFFGEIVLCFIYLRLIFKTKYDISLVNTEIFSFSLFVLNLISPIYVVIHSLSFKDAGFYSKVLFFIQKKFVKKYLAVSNAVKDSLGSFYIGANVYVAYNGVAIPIEKNKKVCRPLKIISVIHPVPHKGAHLLVDVATDLNKLNIDFEWTILGWYSKTADQKYAETIIRRIEDLKLGQKMKIIGSVDNIEEWYSISDLLVHPSLSESFGFAVAEAMSHSLPVIAFSVGALPELIENGKNGYLIEPFKTAEMSNKIQAFINDSNLLHEFGYAARNKIVSNFEIKKTMTEVYRILDLY